MKLAEIFISLVTTLCWQTEWKDDFSGVVIKTSQEIQENLYIVKVEKGKKQSDLYFVSTYPLSEFSISKEDETFLTRFTKNSASIYEKKFDIVIPNECFKK